MVLPTCIPLRAEGGPADSGYRSVLPTGFVILLHMQQDIAEASERGIYTGNGRQGGCTSASEPHRRHSSHSAALASGPSRPCRSSRASASCVRLGHY